jgi:prepilin peptidase CpaA
MPQLSLGSFILILVVSLFTAAAAVWDMRQRRIPNALTVPVFLAGWIYQGVFHHWAGLADAGLGFAIGFGTLFILWITGGGGGGDVKLMGALSVWLGFHLTLLVVIVSTALVLVFTIAAIAWSFARGNGHEATQMVLGGGTDSAPGRKSKPETVEQRKERRIMAYALPVAVATWLVLVWKLPTLP